MSIASIVKKKHSKQCSEWRCDPLSGKVGCTIAEYKALPCNGITYGGHCNPADWGYGDDEEVKNDGI